MLILVCEDDAAAREAVVRVLAEVGHVVLEADSGTAALEIMRRERPDLVLLDMILKPDMTGWEVAERKRIEPAIAGIPTVVVSGMPPAEVRRRGMPSGASAIADILLILQKPLATRTLLRAIDHIEQLKRLEAP
jgi:CheY-like chemotaxis protein